MKATVVEIQSKDYFHSASKRRSRMICLRFKTENDESNLRLPEHCLGIVGLALDDEIEVSFHIERKELTFQEERRHDERRDLSAKDVTKSGT